MKSIQNLQSRMHSVRFLVAMLLGAILLFSNAIPAMAAHNDARTQTATEMKKVLDKTEDTIKSPPMTLEEVEERSEGNLNEVQGDTAKDKMIRSDDSKPAVLDQIEKALDKVTK